MMVFIHQSKEKFIWIYILVAFLKELQIFWSVAILISTSMVTPKISDHKLYSYGYQGACESNFLCWWGLFTNLIIFWNLEGTQLQAVFSNHLIYWSLFDSVFSTFPGLCKVGYMTHWKNETVANPLMVVFTMNPCDFSLPSPLAVWAQFVSRSISIILLLQTTS